MKLDSGAVSREAHSKFTTSITTGQGGTYNDLWMPKSSFPSCVGNSRAPTPKCCIKQSTGLDVGTISFSAGTNFPDIASAELADNLLTKFDEVIASSGAASLDSTQGQVIWQPEVEEESLQTSESEFDLSGEDLDINGFCEPPAAEAKSLYKRKTRKREKKKVGRPIVYKGDPNAPELSEQERRRIKRRIANRESARRVRHKRQEVMEDLQCKMEQLQAKNLQLSQRAREEDNTRSQVSIQLADLSGKLSSTKAENEKMQQEICALRSSLQMKCKIDIELGFVIEWLRIRCQQDLAVQLKMTALEEELDKRASEAEIKREVPLLNGSEADNSFPLQTYSLEAKPSLEMRGAIDWLPSLKLDDSFGMLHEILPEFSK